jgi:hypothetical protein
MEGLHPTVIGLLHIWRALSRATLMNVFFCCCIDHNRYIFQKGPTKYTAKGWDDYMDELRFLNFFSVRDFVLDETTLSRILLRIPLVNVLEGAIHLAIGLITLPFTTLFTCVIPTKSISWLRWSSIHILEGVLGITVIGIYVYDTFFADNVRAKIFEEAGIDQHHH